MWSPAISITTALTLSGVCGLFLVSLEFPFSDCSISFPSLYSPSDFYCNYDSRPESQSYQKPNIKNNVSLKDFFIFSACTSDRNPSCESWAAVGDCEKNTVWMLLNCCVSCKYHQAPKGKQFMNSLLKI